MMDMTRDELLDAITELRVSRANQLILKHTYSQKVYEDLSENNTEEELASLFEQERTKKYRVHLNRSQMYYVDVKATTKEEAEALAEDMAEHYTYITDSIAYDIVKGDTEEVE